MEPAIMVILGVMVVCTGCIFVCLARFLTIVHTI